MFHDHCHDHWADSFKGLWWTLVLTAIFMLVEFAGGWLSGSLALVSDAGHMLTDVLALGLSLLAIRFAITSANAKKTYGFYRLEILAALLNGVTLIVLSGYIFYEAWQRFSSPAEINSGLMIIVALAGLAVNLAGFFTLRASSKQSLNVRGAFLHVVGDLLSSVAVIIGGLVIRFTGWLLIDPILSVLIGALILKGAYGLVKESADILLEAAPAGVESAEIEQALSGMAGVRAVHHLHVWSLSSGIHALSAHVQIDDQMTSQSDALLAEIQELLEHEFGILHTTVQFECAECGDMACSPANGGEHKV
ncbi:cation transporter [candidate division TA06 bacterium]|uniref:Cation transporter n=1 Tax=candidate division TA06 bacterium TaxID=2250710 RepID=A0A933IBG5_UNCT6|nr:cation transporter [candidate division TA06 bacterium]